MICVDQSLRKRNVASYVGLGKGNNLVLRPTKQHAGPDHPFQIRTMPANERRVLGAFREAEMIDQSLWFQTQLNHQYSTRIPKPIKARAHETA